MMQEKEQDNGTPLINILIVDDHWMLRQGLKHILNTQKKAGRFRIEEAENGKDALAKIRQTDFDLVLLDYEMPGLNGAEVARQMLAFKPLNILALSNYDELSIIEEMRDAGIKGYILKNIEPADFLKAIKVVLAGKTYYSNDVYARLLDGEKGSAKRPKPASELTRRELEVLQMIVQEKTNAEIAEALSIEKSTVDSHRHHLLGKLQARNTAGLIKAAYRLDLIK